MLGSEINRKEFWTKYQLCDTFPVHTGNFSLIIRYRLDSSFLEIPCPDFKIRIIDQKGRLSRVHFTAKDCQQYVSLTFFDGIKVEGKNMNRAMTIFLTHTF